MMKFIFDSNIFDKIIDGKIELESLKGGIHQYFATHIQIDELSKTQDSFRMNKLVTIFHEVDQTNLDTESFVIGFSRLGKAKLGNGGFLEKLRRGNIKKTNDALIGEVAIKKKIVLVTEDKELKNKVNENGGTAIFFIEFKEMLK